MLRDRKQTQWAKWARGRKREIERRKHMESTTNSPPPIALHIQTADWGAVQFGTQKRLEQRKKTYQITQRPIQIWAWAS